MDIRNILLVVSLGLSVLIGLTLSHGHGIPHQSTERPLIGLSLDTEKEARWQADASLFVQRCNALGADVKVLSANGDDAQQVRDVQSLLAAGCKTLVIVPHDGRVMAKQVDQAQALGVAVIAYDRLIENCDLDLYLSFDNIRVGREQAQYLIDHLPTPGHGNIVRIYGAPTDHNAVLFKQGQDQALAPYLKRGDIKVVKEDWAADWKPENAKAIVNAAFVSGLTFDAILASNDSTASGAVQSLLEHHMAGKILVTGQDADLDACQRIAAGTQTMTIYKPLRALATLAADRAVDLARGRPIVARDSTNNGQKDVPSILHDVVVVTRDNMLQTVVRDGFHTYDQIYGKLPAEDRPARP